MNESRAERTLVKSPPELWSELSDPAALARHLGEFGEIRITRLEPESRVEWEAERARGSVELAAAGWGTRVTLTAEVTGAEAAGAEPSGGADPRSAPDPVADPANAAGAGGNSIEPWGEWRLPEWPVEAWTTAGAAARPQPTRGAVQVGRLSNGGLQAAPAQWASPEPAAPSGAEGPESPPEPRESSPAPTQSSPDGDAALRPSSDGDPTLPAGQPGAFAEHPAARRPGFFARMFGWRGHAEDPVVRDPGPDDLETDDETEVPPAGQDLEAEPNEPESEAVPSEPELDAAAAAKAEDPEPELGAIRTEAVLSAVLDDLGAAHHRPFSR